jgi:hypothetical protein
MNFFSRGKNSISRGKNFVWRGKFLATGIGKKRARALDKYVALPPGGLVPRMNREECGFPHREARGRIRKALCQKAAFPFLLCVPWLGTDWHLFVFIRGPVNKKGQAEGRGCRADGMHEAAENAALDKDSKSMERIKKCKRNVKLCIPFSGAGG